RVLAPVANRRFEPCRLSVWRLVPLRTSHRFRTTDAGPVRSAAFKLSIFRNHMARYTGPRVRISRRFGVPIFGPSKYLERRNYGPGMHGPKSRRKNTDYALGLIEKQKLRYYYGLMERQ